MRAVVSWVCCSAVIVAAFGGGVLRANAPSRFEAWLAFSGMLEGVLGVGPVVQSSISAAGSGNMPQLCSRAATSVGLPRGGV